MASPSKNQNYAYLSRLSTQKLLELLAAAPAPAETPEDKAYIDAIVEVVLEREERHPTGLLPDPEQAWEEFQQYYNTPEGEDLSPLPGREPRNSPIRTSPLSDRVPAPKKAKTPLFSTRYHSSGCGGVYRIAPRAWFRECVSDVWCVDR